MQTWPIRLSASISSGPVFFTVPTRVRNLKPSGALREIPSPFRMEVMAPRVSARSTVTITPPASQLSCSASSGKGSGSSVGSGVTAGVAETAAVGSGVGAASAG